MEATTCLICNESVLGGSKGTQKKARNSSNNNEAPPHPQLLSDAKLRFTLTSVQYTILQKVLSLPEGTCRGELMGGPYCRECFANINNVCHIMSALEKLQESIQEFRKDFGAKMSASLGEHETLSFSSSGRKRRSVNTGSNDKWNSVRKILLDCLYRHSFVLGNIGAAGSNSLKQSPGNNKAKHLHEIISEFDPDCKPETNVKADLVLRTTNGNMPVVSRTKKLTYKAQTLETRKHSVASSSKSKPKSSSSNIGKAFVCRHESCKEGFPTLSALNVHRERAHLDTQAQDAGTGDYVCWYCNKEFQTDNELKSHEREHTTSRKCPICHKTFGRVNYLNLHMMSHSTTATPVAPSKKKSFVKSSQVTLVKEKSNRHMNWPKCDVCYKVFPNKKTMVNHKVKEHSRSSDSAGPRSVSKAKLAPVQSKDSSGKTFRPARCKVCVKIVMDLPSHMRSAHPEIPLANGNKEKTTNSCTAKMDSSNAPSSTTSNVTKPGPASRKKSVKQEGETLRSRETESSAEDKSDRNLKHDEKALKIKVEKDKGLEELEFKSEDCKKPIKVKTEAVVDKVSDIEANNSKVKIEDKNSETTIKHEKEPPSLSVSQSPPLKKGFISTANCLLPPSLPSASKTQGSRYQFKNLLKIGEDLPKTSDA